MVRRVTSLKDLSGQTFGRWSVIEPDGINARRELCGAANARAELCVRSGIEPNERD